MKIGYARVSTKDQNLDFPSIITVIAFSACFYFFSQALNSVPLGIAYAIWAGLGIVLTANVSVVIFKQRLDTPAILGMLLIVLGVVVINVFQNLHLIKII